jgi:hypothetical protein
VYDLMFGDEAGSCGAYVWTSPDDFGIAEWGIIDFGAIWKQVPVLVRAVDTARGTLARRKVGSS